MTTTIQATVTLTEIPPVDTPPPERELSELEQAQRKLADLQQYRKDLKAAKKARRGYYWRCFAGGRYWAGPFPQKPRLR